MTCQAKTSSGLHCKIRAQSGSEYCFFHDVRSRKERQAAQSRGGRARKLSRSPLPVEPFDFSEPAKMLVALTEMANLQRVGRVDAKTVHALAHLVECALKIHSQTVFKQQLDHIERLLEAHRKRPADPAEAEAMLRFAPAEKWETSQPPQPQDEADPAPPFAVDDFAPNPTEIDE